MKSETKIKPRNPLIIIIWTFGLYVLVSTTQYIYFWLGTVTTDSTFGELAGGEAITYQSILLRGIVALLLGIPVLLLVVKFLWRRPWSWLRLRFRPGLLLGGALLGISMVIVVILILWTLKITRITGYPSRFSGRQIAALLIGHSFWILFTAMLEETVFRGMVVREFALRWGWPIAIVAGGLYFSAMHLISIIPILTPLLTISILAAGIAANALFVALYIRSRSLWLPIGFHAGWNFALAAILGTTMSGHAGSYGLFQTELSGRDVLTGGEFGVETSVIAVVLMIVLSICVLWISRGRSGSLLESRSELKINEGVDS